MIVELLLDVSCIADCVMCLTPDAGPGGCEEHNACTG